MSGLWTRLGRQVTATLEELVTFTLHALSVIFFAAITAAADLARRRLVPGWAGWPIFCAEVGFGFAFTLRGGLIIQIYWRRLFGTKRKKP